MTQYIVKQTHVSADDLGTNGEPWIPQPISIEAAGWRRNDGWFSFFDVRDQIIFTILTALVRSVEVKGAATDLG